MSGERPLRVTYLDHMARLSGAEIALVRLLRAAGPGLDATVILAKEGELVDPLRAAGARVEILPLAEGARGLKRDDVRPGGGQA
ncbi:MAG: hypothetical protein WB462_08065, partial [Solirubrobacterales bacterium]